MSVFQQLLGIALVPTFPDGRNGRNRLAPHGKLKHAIVRSCMVLSPPARMVRPQLCLVGNGLCGVISSEVNLKGVVQAHFSCHMNRSVGGWQRTGVQGRD